MRYVLLAVTVAGSLVWGMGTGMAAESSATAVDTTAPAVTSPAAPYAKKAEIHPAKHAATKSSSVAPKWHHSTSSHKTSTTK